MEIQTQSEVDTNKGEFKHCLRIMMNKWVIGLWYEFKQNEKNKFVSIPWYL